MEQKELMEQVRNLLSENPAKYIKIRDAFDNMFGDRRLESAGAISDREFERLRYRFRDADVPLSWCASKEAAWQLYKAVDYHRTHSRTRRDDTDTAIVKKSTKPRKKGFFGLFR